MISIHALREEGDPSSAVRFWLQKVFLSTPSARRATPDSRRAERGLAHFYPRPPRGGRPVMQDGLTRYVKFLSTPSARRATCCRPPARGLSPISIHALREEGDPQDHDHNQRGRHFYPRPPRGGRQACIFTRTITSLFLSTPSARRATFYRPGRYLPGMISIHALREEGDPSSAVRFWLQKVFLSTPSARRATPRCCHGHWA